MDVIQKLGGVLAFFQIGKVISWLNQRAFGKEIKEKIEKGEVTQEEEQRLKKPEKLEDLCSIENMLSVLQRLKKLEEKAVDNIKIE